MILLDSRSGALATEQFINALTLGALYALIALGYTMVYGIIELINFAHGDIFMVGSFVVLVADHQQLGFTDGAIHDPLVARRSSLLIVVRRLDAASWASWV